MPRTSTPKLLTIEEARAQLDARGESVAEFARRHKLNARSVYGVLYGDNKGRRGAAHKAAVALGLKAGL
ncbi:DNA-binding protein [Thermomonas fusca]